MDVAEQAERAVGGEAAPEVPRARPWARFWARYLDTVLESLVVGAAFGLVFPGLADELSNDRAGGIIVGMILLPFVLALDAAIQALFGQTIGKAIAGIRVELTSGDRPSIKTALRRNARLYVHGMVIGLPILSLVGYGRAYGVVKEGRQTSWDLTAGTSVRARGANLARTILTTALTFAVYAGLEWAQMG